MVDSKIDMPTMKKHVVFGVLKILVCIELVTGAYSSDVEREIRGKTVLAAGYDPISRPAGTTIVNVGIRLYDIDELDIHNQLFQVSGWIIIEWSDPRLIWDPKTNGNIETVMSPQEQIWKPDIAIDNVADDLNTAIEDNINVRYYFTGRVLWQSRRFFKSYCQAEQYFYPYEERKCSLVMVGWNYNSSEVSLGFMRDAISTLHIRAENDWNIAKTETLKTELEEALDDGTLFKFPKLVFVFSIKRDHKYQYVVFLLPVIVTSLLVNLTFLIPNESGEKLFYIVALFLSQTVLLTTMVDVIPADFIRVSGLDIFLGVLTTLSAQAIISAVQLLRIHHIENQDDQKTINEHWVILAAGNVAAWCLCSPLRDKAVPDLSQTSTPTVSEPNIPKMPDLHLEKLTFKDAAFLLEKLMLYVYFFEILIFIIVLFLGVFGHLPIG